MKYLLIIPVFAFFLSTSVSAQTIADAYRLSNQRINGTARSSAMGNAFGALGGDITSLSINPAGIGVYRTGEFVLTPVIKSNDSELSLNGNNFTDNKFQINLNNIGLIGVVNLRNEGSGIVSFNYGLGYNNIMDFNQNYYGMNNGSPNSYLDGIVNYANSEGLSNAYLNQNLNQIDYRDWPTKLAWDTYLINPALDNNNNEIDGEYNSLLYTNETVDQRKSYSQSGGIDEFVLSGGININHKAYLGASFGIQNVDLNQRTEYTEILENNDSYTFGEDYSLTGTGYNFKFGAIFKPTNNLRLGAAIHTPTYYVLNEQKQIFINSRLLDNHSSDGINLYDYNFYNPWKAILSGAYTFGKKGLISFDAEYVDYTTMKFRRSSKSNEDLSDINNEISANFKKAINYRLGAEYKITPQFSVRGGYEFYPNSQKQPLGDEYQPGSLDNSSIYAFGFGYASYGFFTDISFRNITEKYLLNEVQPNFKMNPTNKNNDMNLTNKNNKILLTVGYKF